MPISVKVSGSWKTVSGPAVKVSGSWKNLAAGFVRVSGAWKQFYTAIPTLTASLSPSSVSGSGYGTGPFTTNSTTATPSGGVSPYSYDWEYVSGDGTVSAVSDSSATTTFTASGTPTQTKNSTWRCKVTDNAASVAYTNNVSIAITFNPALSVGLDTTSAFGEVFASGPPWFFPPCTTNSVTASGSGGASPYTYLWEYVSGDTQPQVNSASSATTTWTTSSVPINPASYSALWRCKVTDNVGNIAYSANVSVTTTFSDL